MALSPFVLVNNLMLPGGFMGHRSRFRAVKESAVYHLLGKCKPFSWGLKVVQQKQLMPPFVRVFKLNPVGSWD